MLSEYRTDSQWLFAAGLLALVFGLFFTARKQTRPALWLLLLGILFLRLFAANLDPFLNDWDERFHALVAANIVEHPFVPRLHANPVVDYPSMPDYWVNSTVWLHKQPLYLWQIALSFALFGKTVFALRLPSVLLSVGIGWILYRIGWRLVNARTGLLAAFFFAVAWMPLELTSGRLGMEHNDIAFLFYVTASVWAWVEYQVSGKTKWLWLIGLFSGGAIMVKWLVGLLVYAGWGVRLLVGRQSKQAWLDMAKALLVTLLVVVPWQVYTWIQFPELAAQEMAYNSQHLWIAVEGHSGPWTYHLERLTHLYGPWAWYLIPLGLISLASRITKPGLRLGVVAMPLIVYLFFTIVQTKLPAYPLVAGAVLFVALGALVDRIWQWLSSRKQGTLLGYSLVVGVMVLGWFHLRFEQTTEWHSHQHPEPHVQTKLANQQTLENWKKALPARSVIFNVVEHRKVEVMFFTGHPAYPFLPTPSQVQQLNQEGYQCFVINPPEPIAGTQVLEGALKL